MYIIYILYCKHCKLLAHKLLASAQDSKKWIMFLGFTWIHALPFRIWGLPRIVALYIYIYTYNRYIYIHLNNSEKKHACQVHPRKLTWIPKIAIFERRYIKKTSFLVSMLDFFGGCICKHSYTGYLGPWFPLCVTSKPPKACTLLVPRHQPNGSPGKVRLWAIPSLVDSRCLRGFLLHPNSSFHEFAHIPWEDTPNFPKPPQTKKFLHKLLVKRLGYLPGYVGEILESS